MTLRLLYKKALWLIPVFLLQAGVFGPVSSAATSVSQFGITWNFDRDYPTGQFANGDYWVVGPIKITNITPRTTISGGHTLHGSMINPGINASHGYDSRLKYNTFDAKKNAGAVLPLTLQPGTSLLSSESYVAWATGDNPQLKTIAILTVLGSPAPVGSFRPPPVSTNKTLSWNKSQLNYSVLRSLAPVSSTPSLSSVEALFERPWIEQGTTWVSRYLHPGANQPTYGREIGHTLAQGLLSLQLNYTKAQKEKLAIRLVQYGIDIYGSARAGGVWPAGGGHNQGRKMPMLLAGAMLGDANILAMGNGSNRKFQEDSQTWYVTQADVGRTLYTADGRPRVKYVQSDVGLPEWGEKHYPEPQWDGRNWDSYYRTVSGSSTVGHVLAARLMNLEKTWNWPAIFDYNDRYWSIEKGRVSTGANSIQPFVAAMWSAYRSATPSDFTEDNVATEIWQNVPVTAQTGTFTVAFDMLASANAIDGITGLSNGPANDFADVAAAVRFSPTGYIDARNGGIFQAASALRYIGGVKYRVVMTVNVATKRYSVSVTPAGGSPVVIADGWQFRTEQTSATMLNNLGYLSVSGYHAVLDVGIQTDAAPPQPPAPTAPVWQNVAIPSQSGAFTIEFDSVPSANKMDGITGLSNGAAGGYEDLAAALRFASSGFIDARNGSAFQAAAVVPYFAGVKYRVVMSVDVLAKRYSATIAPAGGVAVKIADNYKFRTDQASASLLNNVGYRATGSCHAVLDVGVQPTVAEPASLTNGSFENGTANWTLTGNIEVKGVAPHTPSNGTKVLVFNAGQATPNGVVSQTFATTVGRTYAVAFDVGVLAFNTKEQRLSITVQGATTLVSKTISVIGKAVGVTAWQSATYTFVANSGTTQLIFKDVSPTSDSLDLLLDNVRVTSVGEPVTAVPAPALTPTFANGSFENGTTNWNSTGNLGVMHSAPYTCTNGTKVLVFNAGQATPNGVVSQSFATTAGRTYTIAFDVGTLAFNTKEQRLSVAVQGVKTLLSKTVSVFGKGGGTTGWQAASYTFVADSSTTQLIFKDASPTSDSVDLLLDNVRVTP